MRYDVEVASETARNKKRTSDVQPGGSSCDASTLYLCTSYFDNYFVHTETENGLSEIEAQKRRSDVMLKTLGGAQLHVNVQKCFRGIHKIFVLVCIVGKHGVRADLEMLRP